MEIDIKKVMSLDLYKILDVDEEASDNDVSNARTIATRVTGNSRLKTAKFLPPRSKNIPENSRY